MSIVQKLEDQIQQLIQYMNVKISQRDWHGVADAAMDIRELEAKIQVHKELTGFERPYKDSLRDPYSEKCDLLKTEWV